jgi:hypothetical protein
MSVTLTKNSVSALVNSGELSSESGMEVDSDNALMNSNPQKATLYIPAKSDFYNARNLNIYLPDKKDHQVGLMKPARVKGEPVVVIIASIGRKFRFFLPVISCQLMKTVLASTII